MQQTSIFKIPALLMMLALLAAPFAARAQIQGYTFSEGEKAVFAFFQLIHQKPNFKGWSTATPKTRQASPDLRAAVAEQELLRLQWGFGTLDVANTPLHIQSDILLQLTPPKDGAANSILNFKFVNSGQVEVPYFPYPYGDEWIALIINDLGNFTSVPVGPEQTKTLHQYMKDGEILKAKIHLTARAVSADASKPLSLDGVEQWMMLGETGYIAFVYTDPATRQDVTLWSYTAPGFLTASEKQLLPLIQK